MSFPGIVSQTWVNIRNLEESINRFTKEATSWNKNQFGKIHSKKKRILARIYGIQRAIAFSPSASLINFENQLHKELEVILDQERDLWALKSRINWMIQGDRNTYFYHMSALARRKRNHIALIKNEVGEWITKEGGVMDHFRKGFISLYTNSQMMVPQKPIHNL